MQHRIESNVTKPAIPVRVEHDIPAYLASDEALIHALSRYPARMVEVSRYDFRQSGSVAWTRGQRGNADAATVLDAVKTGQLRVVLRDLQTMHPGLWAEIRLALARLDPEFEINAENLLARLVISSATACTPCRFDTKNVLTFQLRGFQRMWVYPTDEAHLPQSEVEATAAGQASGRLPQNRVEDSAAWRFGVVPGEALSWPLHSPYYSENEEGLCVSVMVTYDTASSRFTNRLHLANNVLRQWGQEVARLDTMPRLQQRLLWLASFPLLAISSFDGAFRRSRKVTDLIPCAVEQDWKTDRSLVA
jgi:hypothetical protein